MEEIIICVRVINNQRYRFYYGYWFELLWRSTHIQGVLCGTGLPIVQGGNEHSESGRVLEHVHSLEGQMKE
jgi:hypothetical protein